MLLGITVRRNCSHTCKKYYKVGKVSVSMFTPRTKTNLSDPLRIIFYPFLSNMQTLIGFSLIVSTIFPQYVGCDLSMAAMPSLVWCAINSEPCGLSLHQG